MVWMELSVVRKILVFFRSREYSSTAVAILAGLLAAIAIDWFSRVVVFATEFAPNFGSSVTMLPDQTDAATDSVDESRPGEPRFEPIRWEELQPEILPEPAAEIDADVPDPLGASDLLMGAISSGQVERSLLGAARRSRAFATGSDVVFGREAPFRATSDTGNLLKKSHSAQGIGIQQRTPIVTDPRIRGDRIGRLLASGSYWAPARQDLDTMLSKIDSRVIRDVLVIKGPYSSLYGPGFNFVDFQILPSPRFADGPDWKGLTSLEFKTNAEQWYGRQILWGGAENYGYRVGYGHRTGNDYTMGNGEDLPTSYNSRDLDLALGYDLADDRHLEFNFLRLDQTGVEFPGLIFDINALVTNGFEMTYVMENVGWSDAVTMHGWYNDTHFTGDTSRPSKSMQIPQIREDLDLGPNQFLTTDVDGMSAGYRLAASWGDVDDRQLTLGTDFIRQSQQLNDYVPFRVVNFPGSISGSLPAQNFPIPRSEADDFGLFVNHFESPQSWLRVNVGGRVDFVHADARNNVPGMGTLNFDNFPDVTLDEMSLSEIKQSEIPQDFVLWSLYVNTEVLLTDEASLLASAGHGQRPPSLTELYAVDSYIGTLNTGFNLVAGDPQLRAEKRTQIDLGVKFDFGPTRARVQGFYAWINDYITYDFVVGNEFGYVPGDDLQALAYTNTDLATLAGFEFALERDISAQTTLFAVMSYVEGTDHSRLDPSRIGNLQREQLAAVGSFPSPPYTRSLYAGNNVEPLPNISPLEATLGLRIHEAVANPNWGLELAGRLVAAQDRVATSLYEFTTPAFATGDIRGFWSATRNLMLIGGVENFTNTFYREHLDYRVGLGVYQPGVNFYFASELTY